MERKPHSTYMKLMILIRQHNKLITIVLFLFMIIFIMHQYRKSGDNIHRNGNPSIPKPSSILDAYSKNDDVGHYSQGDQDTFISKFFTTISPRSKYFVEFGFNAGDYSTGSGANTELLYSEFGWTGLLLDGGNENMNINLHKEWICSNNIIELFKKYKVPKNVDYISIDFDSNDFWVFESILQSEFKPLLFSVEYNSHYPLESFVGLKNNCTRTFECRAYSASASALMMLAGIHQYRPVHITKSLDIFFVPHSIYEKYNWSPIRLDQIVQIGHVPCDGKWRNEFMDLYDYMDKKYKITDRSISGMIS